MADKIIADRDAGLSLVSSDGLALKRLSKALKKNKTIVLAAVKQAGLALEQAGDDLKANREVVLAAVTHTPQALQHASDVLKADRSLVSRALKKDGMALAHAAGRLKSDKRMVLTAVAQNPKALQFASKKLQQDKDIIAAASHQSTYAAVRVELDQSKTYSEKREPSVVVSPVVVPRAYPAKEKTIRKTDPMAHPSTRSITSTKKMQPEKGLATQPTLSLLDFNHDKERVLQALKVHARLYGYLSEDLKADKRIALAAVREDKGMFQHLPKQLQSDADLLLAKQYQHIHKYLGKHGIYNLKYKDRLKNINKTIERVSVDALGEESMHHKETAKEKPVKHEQYSDTGKSFMRLKEKVDKIINDPKFKDIDTGHSLKPK